jgi:cation diffusion facilitator family transporter
MAFPVRRFIVQDDKQKLGYWEGWVSIVLNTLLFGVKYWTGSRIASVAMVADAWHTLSDTLTSVVVIVGFWIMAKPADDRHPFGHARAENIAAIIIGVLLAVVGVLFGWESIQRLLHRQAASFSLFAILVFLASALLKEGLAQFAFWAGKKAGSQAVTADGWHHRSDAIASALIVAGALLGRKLWWIDGALGIGVSLLIIWAAVDIVRTSSSILLGEAPSAELHRAIVESVRREYPEVDDVHHLHLHRYGQNAELTLHIRLPKAMSVGRSHEIGELIAKRLRDELNLEATVHIDPVGGDPAVD